MYYLCPRLIDICFMINNLPAGGCKAAARPAKVSYLCLDHEFPTLRGLRAHFQARGLDYALQCAGAPAYACAPAYDGGLLLGHLRIVVYYDLFTDPGFAVKVVRSNGTEV